MAARPTGGVRKRFVTAPDGTKWIVGRHWLARRPRYIGFRFGKDPYSPDYEPAAAARTSDTPIRRPRRSKTQPPVPNPYRDNPKHDRPRSNWWIWNSGRSAGRSTGGSSSSGSSGRSSGGGGLFGGSSGGGFRSSSSGGGSRSSSRGKGKSGGGAGAAGLLGLLLKALKWIAIIAAIIAVTLFLIFVGIPSLIFLAQYVLFWLLVGATILYNALTRRPWIITARRDGYGRADHAFRVHGWRRSTTAINDVAEQLRRGEFVTVPDAELVELIDH